MINNVCKHEVLSWGFDMPSCRVWSWSRKDVLLDELAENSWERPCRLQLRFSCTLACVSLSQREQQAISYTVHIRQWALACCRAATLRSRSGINGWWMPCFLRSFRLLVRYSISEPGPSSEAPRASAMNSFTGEITTFSITGAGAAGATYPITVRGLSLETAEEPATFSNAGVGVMGNTYPISTKSARLMCLLSKSNALVKASSSLSHNGKTTSP